MVLQPESLLLVAGSGFLGFNSSVMLDVVFLAMFAVVPLLGLSIYLVKQRKYLLHKRINLVLGAVLLIAVLAFEVDMRLFTDWQALAHRSPYFDESHKWTSIAGLALIVHLCFAVPTLLLWVLVIAQAVRKFPWPPAPGAHSAVHARLGWLAAAGMLMTAITGAAFYYLAFIAERL